MKQFFTRITQLGKKGKLYFLPIVLITFSSPLKAQSTDSFCVLELFTSEGCSSCPGGDNMLNTVAISGESSTANNLYIALHIQYWNYLGWIDPYSNSQYDDMFFGYYNSGNGITFPSGNSFATPLFVRNGETGRNYSTSTLNKTATAFVELSFNEIVGNQLKVNYTLSGDLINTEARFFLVESSLVNTITAGENAGSTLHHENVSRDMEILPTINTTGTVTFAIPASSNREKMRVMAYIRKNEDTPWNREIIGANKGFKLGDFVEIQEIQDIVETNIYPNPSNSSTSILCVEKMEKVTLLDELGNILFMSTPSSNSLEIDLSTFEKGIYFVQIETAKGLVKNKIIKY